MAMMCLYLKKAYILNGEVMLQFRSPFPEMKMKKRKALAVDILLKSVTYSFALFGLLFILLLLIVINMLKSPSVMVQPVPNRAVITLDLNRSYPEIRSDDLIAEFSDEPSISFYDLIKAVNVAALDDRVMAIVAQVNNSHFGLAQIQGLRQAIKDFRAAGKKAYLYSTGMGSFGGGTDEYYLATAFDEIWMQPNTEIGITGLNIEVPFLKGLLDKIGVIAEFYARHEYKNAAASLLYSGFTAPYKKETEQMGRSLFEQIVDDISSDRGIDKKRLCKLIDKAPVFAEDGLNEKLIDKIAYRPELIEQALDEALGQMIDMYDYASSIAEGGKRLPLVAFVTLDGTIDSGKSQSNPLRGDNVTGAETFIQQLDEIAMNKDVRAVVLRINSPGGSYSASNEIWNALVQLRNKSDLPIVVSMGDYAASGGYFVALAGDMLLAEPSTITGSIGVLGGKVAFSGLWDKLKVNWGEVKFGANSGILSVNHKFSAAERAVFNKSLDNVYHDFTTKVAEARNIAPDKMDKLARGRIWTGKQAVENGLVDELGGISQAVAWAKKLSGLPPQSRFGIIYYPKAKTFQEKIAELVGGGAKISVNKAVKQMGLDIESVNMLQRLQYETVLPLFKLNM